MLKRFFLICSLAVFVSASCDDLIDFEPEAEAPEEYILSSASNVEAALLGAYGKATGDRLYGQQIPLYGDAMSDNVDVSRLSNTDFFGQVALYNTNSFNSNIRDMWIDGYNIIANANKIIDAIDRGIVQGASPATLARWRAECLFLRAALHFDLVRYFAQPYSNGNGNQLGIVIRNRALTTEEASAPTPLNTVGEVHAQVIADLIAAAAVLPATNGNRATSWAAKALLARVYFNMNRFSDAFTTANEVVQSPLFRFRGTPINQFRAADNVPLDSTVVFQWVLNRNPGISGSTRPQSQTVALTEGTGSLLQALQNSGATDARFGNNFTERRDGTDQDGRIYSRKWDVNSNLNVPYLRLAEMHLIRAESALDPSVNNLAAAVASYNAVRGFYVSGFVPVTAAIGSAALLDLVRAERRIELAFEGDRFHDLRRRQLNVRDRAYNDPTIYLTLPLEEIGNGNL